jgi:hypothetical protein
VSLTVTDDAGDASAPATTTATIEDFITGGPILQVEIKMFKAIKKRKITPVKIELGEDYMDLRIAGILCGPNQEGAKLVSPKRLVQKGDGEALALFITKDLGINSEETQLMCTGTLEPGAMKFIGTSNHDGNDDNDDDDHHQDDD